MPTCEQCGREFSNQESLDQHNRDKHDAQGMTKHEVKQKKKQERLMQQAEEKGKMKRSKTMKMIAIIAAISFALAVIVYAVMFLLPSTPPTTNTDDLLSYNLAAHTGSLALHIHPRLEIWINGEKQIIPADIGISPQGMRVLHTHETDGTIHLETPYPAQLHLKDFFTIWEKSLSDSCVFEFCEDETHDLKVFVNDEEVQSNFGDIPLRDLDRIKIVYAEI